MDAMIWIVAGIAISQGLGYWLTKKYLYWIRDDLKRTANSDKSDPPKWGKIDWMTGVIERLFFTIIVSFNVGGAAVAMTSWLLVKMATDWHRIQSKEDIDRSLAFCSLTAGMVSLTFALVGGLLIKFGVAKICGP